MVWHRGKIWSPGRAEGVPSVFRTTVGLDDLQDAGVSAGHQGKQGQEDERVTLDQAPLEDTEVAGLLPEGDELDDGRAEQSEDGEEDGAYKWDEGLQVWQRDGNGNWNTCKVNYEKDQ